MDKSFKILLICSIIACSGMMTMIKAQDKDLTVEDYIDKYKDIAIQEMERSGIPASITLAQGIHESAFGNSNLARKANNHFGIKCTSDWKGKSYYKWDDEIKKSCFRVYESAMGSYIDHTDFLVNRKHYAFLFKYDRTDYKNWAKGLRKAGYATDPKYPTKLINTIEKYRLAQYDNATGDLVFDDKNNNKIKDIVSFDGETSFRNKKRSFLFTAYKKGFFKSKNGVTHAIARKGESSLAAAQRYNVPYKRFLRFNDLKDGDQLIDYQYIYIFSKKANYRGKEAFFRVKNDETMYEIAQYFGVKLSALLYKNRMSEGEEPANGALILLKNRADKKPKLRPVGHIDMQPVDKEQKGKKKENNPPKELPKIVVAKVERPKPAEVKINTPTYSEEIYKKKINTAKSKDSTYLNTNLNPTAIITTEEDNPYSSGTNNSAENTTNKTLGSSADSNTAINTERVNSNALFKQATKETDNTSSTTTIINPDENNPFSSVEKVKPVVYPTPTTEKTKTTIPTPAETTTGKYFLHIVKKGETLFSLYREYKISVKEIKSYNKLTSDTIKMGQEIKIPLNK